jgi:hypothetical protein
MRELLVIKLINFVKRKASPPSPQVSHLIALFAHCEFNRTQTISENSHWSQPFQLFKGSNSKKPSISRSTHRTFHLFCFISKSIIKNFGKTRKPGDFF